MNEIKSCESFMSLLSILKKAYNRADGESLWKVLRMYVVDNKLLGKVKSFYSCKVNGKLTGWFDI